MTAVEVEQRLVTMYTADELAQTRHPPHEFAIARASPAE